MLADESMLDDGDQPPDTNREDPNDTYANFSGNDQSEEESPEKVK